MAVVAWRDADHVVVQGRLGDYRSVDVRTGASTRLTSPAPDADDPGTVVAADAWTGPVFTAPEPPSPWDPRMRWGLPLVALIAAGVGAVVWRRRVRP